LDLIEPIALSQIMASKVAKISNQCAEGKRKHVTLTTPQRLEIIRRSESGESCSVVMASYNVGSSTIYDIKEQKDQ
jgi:hypothetical protein